MKFVLEIEIGEGRDPKALAGALEAAFARGPSGEALAADLGVAARPDLRAVLHGGVAISAAEASALAWWIRWTAEDMRQKRYRSEEMERGGEVEKGYAASWRSSEDLALALAERLRR